MSRWKAGRAIGVNGWKVGYCIKKKTNYVYDMKNFSYSHGLVLRILKTFRQPNFSLRNQKRKEEGRSQKSFLVYIGLSLTNTR